MPADIGALCADLRAERADLDSILAAVASDAWSAPTPAVGWSILDQVTHLAWFDEAATRSITVPDEFRRERAEAVADIDRFVDQVATAHRSLTADAARAWLGRAGAALTAAAALAPPGCRVPWYGPDMSLASALTARVMETWAHGQDVADAVGVQRAPSERLRHVAFLGASALGNSFVANGLALPTDPVRVELLAPRGETWAFGPQDALNRVTGPALDFCLVVTQRRHRDDTMLVATGAVADQWLSIAQAFAGPPGSGRAPQVGP